MFYPATSRYAWNATSYRLTSTPPPDANPVPSRWISMNGFFLSTVVPQCEQALSERQRVSTHVELHERKGCQGLTWGDKSKRWAESRLTRGRHRMP